MAEIRRFGVTSKAGFRARAPTGTTRSPRYWISSTSAGWAAKLPEGLPRLFQRLLSVDMVLTLLEHRVQPLVAETSEGVREVLGEGADGFEFLESLSVTRRFLGLPIRAMGIGLNCMLPGHKPVPGFFCGVAGAGPLRGSVCQKSMPSISPWARDGNRFLGRRPWRVVS